MHKEWRQNDEVLNNLRRAYSNIDTVFNFFNVNSSHSVIPRPARSVITLDHS